jgi:Na+/proline symporter
VDQGHLVLAILVLAVVGITYTLIGGIGAVIWTDVIQTVVIVGAALAALLVLLQRIPVGVGEIWSVLESPGPGQPSKLTVLDPGIHPGAPGLGIDLAAPFTLLTAVLGWTLFNAAAYGTDQDMAQRMLTCRSAARGSWSAIVAILAGIPVTTLFMVLGLLLYVFYARPDVMGTAAPAYEPEGSRKIFLEFILREMPRGLCGLMMAGLFAAALSSFNSALNAMASTFVGDTYRKLRPRRDERHYLLVGRLAVVGWGVVLAAFAVGCIWWQPRSKETLIEFALGVMAFAYAGLLAVYLCAIFTRRGSSGSVLAALATGFVMVFVLQPQVWSVWAPDAVADVTLASPWRLLVAVALAFIVCCLGRQDRAGV